jgi:hypothetical protein
MLHQVLAEGVLEDKKLVIEVVLRRDAVLVLYRFFPHPHELPLLELAEETVGFDVVVAVTFDQPLAERQEFLWHLVLVLGDTLARQRVVLVTRVSIGGHLEVVWVAAVVVLQVEEDGFFVGFAIE